MSALSSDVTSVDDATAVSYLPSGPDIDLYLNLTSNNPNGFGSIVPYLDNDGDANNSSLSLTRANAKALSLISPSSSLDATITLNSDVTWDFDRSNGISVGAIDFVGVAIHEIGHALGFVSGVDVLDEYSLPKYLPSNDDQFNFVSTLDVFRYSADSAALGVIDWTADTRDKYFSIDGGVTDLGGFSTGGLHGDGRQASHWKDNYGLGILDPTLASAVLAEITELDLQAFDVIGWDRGFYVTSTADTVDANLADILPFDASGEVTLRAAIQAANASGRATRIIVPEGTYNLTRTGTEVPDASRNDLDILTEISVVGAGAGLSVIDASGLVGSNINARAFEVRNGGGLSLTGVTLTGGDVGANQFGGAVLVQGGGELEVSDSAFVGNRAGYGGAIGAVGYASTGLSADVVIASSVFTGNEAIGSGSTGAGGAVSTGSGPATVRIGTSVFAGNQTSSVKPNVYRTGSGVLVNDGNNVTDSADGFFNATDGDHIGSTPEYIVTSIADRIDSTDGGLSLREAVIAANAFVGPIQYPPVDIWIPPWLYLLTLRGEGENVAATGDIDVLAAVTIRAAGAATVDSSLYALDSAFEDFSTGLVLTGVTPV